jgi:hypothetical protein
VSERLRRVPEGRLQVRRGRSVRPAEGLIGETQILEPTVAQRWWCESQLVDGDTRILDSAARVLVACPGSTGGICSPLLRARDPAGVDPSEFGVGYAVRRNIPQNP